MTYKEAKELLATYVEMQDSIPNLPDPVDIAYAVAIVFGQAAKYNGEVKE